MSTLLIKNADYIVSLDKTGRVLRKTSILIEGNKISQIGTKINKADSVIDASGKIVLPGFINAHHHLSQAFLRHVPEFQNQRIDKQINLLCRLTKKMTPEAHYWAAKINMAELIFSGCTTTTDFLYIFPKQYDAGQLFEASIKAAKDLGIRFHPFRGSMSLSKKDKALFADDVVEPTDKAIINTEKAIKRWHQRARDGMVKVGIAPCAVFTNTSEDFRQAALLAKKYKVNLQTHLSETKYEQDFVRKKYKTTPVEYLQKLGWDNDKVSWVHGIELEPKELKLIKKFNQSVCHCPISNARSAIGQKGIAPVWEILKLGINLALGTDGSAGNDSSNILEEMRWARTLQGVRPEATYLKPMDVFYMVTVGGAKALAWDDMLGSLEPGKCADIVIFDINDSIAHIGAWDKVGSLISCQSKRADTVIINGKIVVIKGQLISQNETTLIKKSWQVWHKIYGS
ncbi:amidohydrolase family protein [Patescibacteria group bacterium]|nr:amidohydrolase family protein [Patescibacteria group bacterium]